ncbi:uncharacterized protein LOC128931783 isoform X2 [Callithrix jacchus]|uniref:uncharacterized protein LOC128931783 isoform X2 n=1 Tax=Callithrix jacchus TaxID=9483 RepID=UPI0023DD2281|nr:uncharacterized protein LOC128931783 isoform X2 [Callithrix jacchus]
MTGIFVVGSEGSSSCFFLFRFPPSSSSSPLQVLMDGRRLRRGGKNPWLVMSESCLNAQRGGRRERERDSKAVSLVCAPARAVLALPWARARGLRVSRERVRAAASRVLGGARVPGAARPSPAQLRCALPPARGSARAAQSLRLPGVLPPGGAGGSVREKAGEPRAWT